MNRIETMAKAEADIIAESPRLAEPRFAATLGHAIVARSMHKLLPPKRAIEFLVRNGSTQAEAEALVYE